MRKVVMIVVFASAAVIIAGSCKRHSNATTTVTPVTSVVVPPVIPMGFSAYINNTLWIPTIDSASFRFISIGRYGDSLYALSIHASDSTGTRKILDMSIIMSGDNVAAMSYLVGALSPYSSNSGYSDSSLRYLQLAPLGDSGSVTITKVSTNNIQGTFYLSFSYTRDIHAYSTDSVVILSTGQFNIPFARH